MMTFVIVSLIIFFKWDFLFLVDWNKIPIYTRYQKIIGVVLSVASVNGELQVLIILHFLFLYRF